MSNRRDFIKGVTGLIALSYLPTDTLTKLTKPVVSQDVRILVTRGYGITFQNMGEKTLYISLNGISDSFTKGFPVHRMQSLNLKISDELVDNILTDLPKDFDYRIMEIT